MEGAATGPGERGHACMTPQLLSREWVLTDDFHQSQHLFR
jgi:hypothetical protein